VGIEEPITVRSLSNALGVKTSDIMSRLMKQGVFATVNQAVETKGLEAEFRWSVDEQVSKDTTPTFLVHSSEDTVAVVENSLLFYEACLRNGVPAEAHFWPKGGHGFGMNNKTTSDSWMNRLKTWLKANHHILLLITI
jgi:acetyl esterase/lipase